MVCLKSTRILCPDDARWNRLVAGTMLSTPSPTISVSAPSPRLHLIVTRDALARVLDPAAPRGADVTNLTLSPISSPPWV